MKIKKIVYTIVSSLITLLVASCSQVPIDNENLPTENISEEQSFDQKQKILNDGFKVGDYRFYLMAIQQNDLSILENIDTTIGKNFSDFKDKINSNYKLNLIPFRADYNNESEQLNINYFLVNNSIEELSSINIQGSTDFKNLAINQEFKIEFSKDQFTLLKPKEFVAFSLSFDLPLNQYYAIKENKVSDFQLNITELEVNGEKTVINP